MVLVKMRIVKIDYGKLLINETCSSYHNTKSKNLKSYLKSNDLVICPG